MAARIGLNPKHFAAADLDAVSTDTTKDRENAISTIESIKSLSGEDNAGSIRRCIRSAIKILENDSDGNAILIQKLKDSLKLFKVSDAALAKRSALQAVSQYSTTPMPPKVLPLGLLKLLTS